MQDHPADAARASIHDRFAENERRLAALRGELELIGTQKASLEHPAPAPAPAPALTTASQLPTPGTNVELLLLQIVERLDRLESAIAANGTPKANSKAPAPAPGIEEEPLFSGTVTVDAGPFADIAELSGFERSLASIDNTEDVFIRTFKGDRAVIDLHLTEPTDLPAELEHALPAVSAVASTAGDLVTVQLA